MQDWSKYIERPIVEVPSHQKMPTGGWMMYLKTENRIKKQPCKKSAPDF